MSHSAEAIVFAFGYFAEIGIDIEYIKRKVEYLELAERFFSENEFRKLSKLSEEDIPIGFFNCWTRKEAFIKAKGDGLGFPLDGFEVSLYNHEEVALLNTFFDPKERSEWFLTSFEPYENYKASLAVRGEVKGVQFLDANTVVSSKILGS